MEEKNILNLIYEAQIEEFDKNIMEINKKLDEEMSNDETIKKYIEKFNEFDKDLFDKYNEKIEDKYFKKISEYNKFFYTKGFKDGFNFYMHI